MVPSGFLIWRRLPGALLTGVISFYICIYSNCFKVTASDVCWRFIDSEMNYTDQVCFALVFSIFVFPSSPTLIEEM